MKLPVHLLWLSSISVKLRKQKKAETDKVTYKDYIEQNEAFLATNKEKAGVTTTAKRSSV